MGQIPRRADIASISNAFPCSIGTVEDHGYKTFEFVRLTNLNGMMPIQHGADPLNNNRYRIIVTSLNSFYIQDPITYDPIDSSNFPLYTSGGYCNIIEQDFIYYNDEE